MWTVSSAVSRDVMLVSSFHDDYIRLRAPSVCQACQDGHSAWVARLKKVENGALGFHVSVREIRRRRRRRRKTSRAPLRSSTPPFEREQAPAGAKYVRASTPAFATL